jgi:hypothetical protein
MEAVMNADLNLTHLHRAARALNAVAAPAHTRPLYLHVADGRFTLTAHGFDLAARVSMPAGLADGAATVPAEGLLLSALAAIAPAGRGRTTARVDLHVEDARLHLTGPAASVALPTLHAQPATAPLADGPHTVTVTTVGVWRATLAAVLPVAGAATHAGGQRVVRLHRQPGACLLVEATDGRRIHRVRIGDSDPEPVDAHLPSAALAPAVKILALEDPAAALRATGHGEHQVWATQTTTIAVRASDRRLPDLERFFDQHTPNLTLSVDAAAMALACTRAAAMAERDQPMRVHVDPAASSITLAVTDEDPDQSARLALTLLASQVQGPAATVRLHPGYTADLFTAAGPGSVQVELPAEDKAPIKIRGDRFTGLLGTYPRTETSGTPGGTG